MGTQKPSPPALAVVSISIRFAGLLIDCIGVTCAGEGMPDMGGAGGMPDMGGAGGAGGPTVEEVD